MSLIPGTRLGPYEIVAPFGAGGMGEVYKARDTRLECTVAVKVLSSRLAGRADLKQRFEREARAISNLNHPHICVLHDIGEQDGVDYLVMEFLEGETLAQRLTRAALPIDQALRYVIEIADALDKAHRHGVVHRDLKPGNIMLTRSGAKLLDFGVAKLQHSFPGAALSADSTQEANLTVEGGILGTLQYMSPERHSMRELSAPVGVRPRTRGLLGWVLAVGRAYFSAVGRSEAVISFGVYAPENAPFTSSVIVSTVSLFPNGRYLLFSAADSSGRSVLWLRSFNSLSAKALPGTGGASYPLVRVGGYQDPAGKPVRIGGPGSGPEWETRRGGTP